MRLTNNIINLATLNGYGFVERGRGTFRQTPLCAACVNIARQEWRRSTRTSNRSDLSLVLMRISFPSCDVRWPGGDRVKYFD